MALYKSAQVNNPYHSKDQVVIYEDENTVPVEDVVEVHAPSIKPHFVIEEEFVVPELPGSELPLEVVENERAAEEAKAKEDENKVEEEKPKNKDDLLAWDGDITGWAKHRMETLPKHNLELLGMKRTVAAMKRAISDMERAVVQDFSGKINIAELEKIRVAMEDGIERLQAVIDKKYAKKKANRDDEIIKEARTAHFQGWVMAVSPLIMRCAQVCVNGSVAAGHDIEKLFSDQVKLYKLSDRDQAELMTVLEHMNYPLRQDRLSLPGDTIEISNPPGDLASNYFA